MEFRFRGTIVANTPLVVLGWIDEDRGSRVRVASTIAAASEPDRILAEAKGLYVKAPESVMDEVPTAQREELEQVFEAFREADH
jgi:hypothetical protein